MRYYKSCLVLFFVLLFSISYPVLVSSQTQEQEEMLYKLMHTYLSWHTNGIYADMTQPFDIKTYEDVDEIPFSLIFTGTSVSRSEFMSSGSRFHLTETEKDNYKTKYGTDEIIYIFKDPGDGFFIKASCGVHSAPPATPPPGVSMAEHWAAWNWPCPGCGRTESGVANHGHSDTAFCQWVQMGINNPSDPLKLTKTVNRPGMEVFSVHIPNASDWSYAKGSDWQTTVANNTHSVNCHKCYPCGNSPYCPGHTDSEGDTYYCSGCKCCSDWYKTTICYKITFNASNLMTQGLNFYTFDRIKSNNYKTKAGQMHWEDRTPPEIWDAATGKQTSDSELPDANAYVNGNIFRATTGDYRSLSVKLYDNHPWAVAIDSQVAIKPASWTFDTNNSGDGLFRFVQFYDGTQTSTANSGNPIKPFQLPSHIFGTIEYAIFASDQSGNLNTSNSTVTQDTPTDCYNFKGFSFNGKTAKNLGTYPPTALGFSFTNADLPPLDAPLPSNCQPKETGHIFVYDNDRPNLLISVANLRKKASGESEYKMIFPPPPATAPVDFWQATDYDDFVKGCSLFYVDYLATSTAYFKPIKSNFGIQSSDNINTTPLMAEAPTDLRSNIFASPNAVNSYFRRVTTLENYQSSDTASSTGAMLSMADPSKAQSVANRMSFGEEIDVLLIPPIEEDVEYEISILAQDNVRYAQNSGGKMTTELSGVPAHAYTPGTGIASVSVQCFNLDSGSITLEFNPPITSDQAWSNSVHGPFTVVFRDPTTITDQTAVPGIEQLKAANPYLLVTTEDLAGNKRQIRLFLQIEDKKSRIRTLEQRYLK